MWRGLRVLSEKQYHFFSPDADQIAVVERAFADYATLTGGCITFKERTTESDYIHFTQRWVDRCTITHCAHLCLVFTECSQAFENSSSSNVFPPCLLSLLSFTFFLHCPIYRVLIINIIPHSAHTSELSGCYSYVGRVGGSQTINYPQWCLDQYGSVQHEMLHALGFYHEQSRFDRDDYVTIMWDNIQAGRYYFMQTYR